MQKAYEYATPLPFNSHKTRPLSRRFIVLGEQLKRGDKSLVGNKGYRRFLKCDGKRFEIDYDKLDDEALFDGSWVLRTHPDLSRQSMWP